MVSVLMGLSIAIACAAFGGGLLVWWALDRRSSRPSAGPFDASKFLAAGPGLSPETVAEAQEDGRHEA
jgi:hypothetical protein